MKHMSPKELAQNAIQYAFSLPTQGAADDVPVGLVPYTMKEIEYFAISILTNAEGDSYLYDESPPDEKNVKLAVQLVKDYFKRCHL